MTVTLTPADLIQPKGRLDAAYFPSGNMDTYLQGWLDQAIVLVDADPTIENANAAAEAYVYMRAYGYLATLWNTIATTTTIAGQITRTINKDQVQFFTNLAEEWTAIYADIGPVSDVTTPFPSQARGGSYHVPVVSVW